MIRLITKIQVGVFALLFVLSSFLTHGDVYVSNSPQLAVENQVIEIQARTDHSPAAMILEWVSDTGSGRIEMTPEPSANQWLAVIEAQDVQGTKLCYTITADYVENSSEASQEYVVHLCPEYTYLKPQAMELNAKVLVRKKWNSDNNAFGLSGAEEGPQEGPASIVCHNDTIYLLDSIKNRILCFDQDGKSQDSIPLPAAAASDMIIDETDSSFVVISQLKDKAYRVKKNRSTQALPLGLSRKMVYPARFSYDSATQTLFAEDASGQNKRREVMRKDKSITAAPQKTELNPQVIAEAQGNNIVLRLEANSQIFAVTFDKPVFCIEESLADSNGVVWVLFTLEGDYRIRRLARIATQEGLAQTAETDIWFSFDATRRMALTRKGVVLFAGDADEGRIVRFNYDGGIR